MGLLMKTDTAALEIQRMQSFLKKLTDLKCFMKKNIKNHVVLMGDCL